MSSRTLESRRVRKYALDEMVMFVIGIFLYLSQLDTIDLLYSSSPGRRVGQAMKVKSRTASGSEVSAPASMVAETNSVAGLFPDSESASMPARSSGPSQASSTAFRDSCTTPFQKFSPVLPAAGRVLLARGAFPSFFQVSAKPRARALPCSLSR